MTHLVVLGFDTWDAAARVLRLGTGQLEREGLLDLVDAALVWPDDEGEVRIQQSYPLVAASGIAGGLTGVLTGTLVGAILLNPAAGLVVGGLTGAAMGSAAGALGDFGIDDAFIHKVGEQLRPGRAAVVMLVRRSTPDRVAQAIKEYGPTVIHTTLTEDREEDLINALQP